MPDNKRKTRREVQAELKATKNKKSVESVSQNETKTTKKRSRNTSSTNTSATTKKKSILSILLLIEAILVLILYNFLGWVIVIILALIPLIFSFLTNRNAKKGLKRPKGTLPVFIIYLIITIIGIRTFGVLGSLVSTSQTNEFYVMALDADEVNKVEEIESGAYIALGATDSYTTSVFPQTKFEEEGFEFNYTNYDSETDEADALLAGSERFIVVSDPKSDELKEIENFSKTTKVIGHYKEKVDIQTGNKKVSKETFTVLLTGTDTRSDAIDSNSRSDSIMVAKVDPKTGTAAIVSIPRDGYVMSSCTGSYDKITHSSLNGMNCLIDDVESLLDIEIDYYMKVNFFTVIDAIDAVGGVDIDVESDFCGQDEYDNLNAYCFTTGETHMSGSEALSYARERHSFSDGDYARARHQQQVISAFLQSLISSGPLAINNLLDVASSSARTNLTASQLTDLAKLLQKTKDFSIETYTIEGTGMYVDIPYWSLYGTSVQSLSDTSIIEAKTVLNAIE